MDLQTRAIQVASDVTRGKFAAVAVKDVSAASPEGRAASLEGVGLQGTGFTIDCGG